MKPSFLTAQQAGLPLKTAAPPLTIMPTTTSKDTRSQRQQQRRQQKPQHQPDPAGPAPTEAQAHAATNPALLPSNPGCCSYAAISKCIVATIVAPPLDSCSRCGAGLHHACQTEYISSENIPESRVGRLHEALLKVCLPNININEPPSEGIPC
eukprot:scaffold89731_cov59-Attheya_sp.AAC.1